MLIVPLIRLVYTELSSTGAAMSTCRDWQLSGHFTQLSTVRSAKPGAMLSPEQEYVLPLRNEVGVLFHRLFEVQ